MKTFIRLSFAAIAFASLPALADTQVVDKSGRPGKIRCNVTADGPVFAEHVDKVIFRLTGAIQAMQPGDQPALNNIPRNTKLDIKVLDNPETIADLEGKVLSFIGAVDNAASRSALVVDEVAYAMVCPLQPNATAD